MSELDEFLEECFLPVLTGRTCFTTDELTLLRLPARLGGIAGFLSYVSNGGSGVTEDD